LLTSWPFKKINFHEGKMLIEAVGIDGGDTSSLEEWLKSQEACKQQRDLEERILKFLFSYSPSDFQFQRMVEQLARIGTKNRSLLEREISALNLSSDAVIPCGGFFKDAWKTTCSVGRFISDHKVEILVGIAVCATGVGIAAVTGYTVSVVAGGVVVAGAGSIFATNEEKANPHIPSVPPPSSAIEIEIAQQSISSPLPKLELPSSLTELLVTSEGIWINGQFFTNTYLMQHSIIMEELVRCATINSKIQSLISEQKLNEFIANIPKNTGNLNVDCCVPTHPQNIPGPIDNEIPGESFSSPVRDSNDPRNVISRKFVIEGTKRATSHIVWINGINNTFEESRASGAYIQTLVGGHAISGVYNCSHTPVIDLLEAALLNHNGFSPITANLLKSEWQAFHEANADRPNARLLQICHSQGAIDVRNALKNSPQEIRDRVIVVAIAPAAIVPDRFCFKSFNYASEKDIVYKLEPSPPPPVIGLTIDGVILPTFGEAVNDRDELVILPPHLDAKGIDHEFISPTYRRRLEKIVVNYKQHNGEYSPEEKRDLE
jgi:hypothetical protein